jgi:hypothetical protein
MEPMSPAFPELEKATQKATQKSEVVVRNLQNASHNA